MQDDLIAVTQADCDLAHDLAYRLTGDLTKAQAYEERERDHWPLVLEIAKHRLQAENAIREQCAVMCEEFYSTAGWTGHYRNAAQSIANAIRASVSAGGGDEH